MANAFQLRNGTILLSTEAPGGIYNAIQLKKIASLCDSHVAIVRATEDQRLALFVKESEVAKVAQELRAIGLGIRHYQDGLHQPVSCLGELCPDHEQDAMGAAVALSKALDSLIVSAPLKIGINGCARCCVPCHTFDIAAVGDASGYRVSLGGKNSQIPEMATFMAEGVPADRLPGLLTQVVNTYREHAQDGESLQDVMERVGSDPFINALAPYSQDASTHVGDPFADDGEGQNPAMADEDVTIGDNMGFEEITEMTDAGEAMATADDLALAPSSEHEEPELIEDFAGVQPIADAGDALGSEMGDFDINPQAAGSSRDLASEIPIGADLGLGLGDDIPMNDDDGVVASEIMEPLTEANPGAAMNASDDDFMDMPDMPPEILEVADDAIAVDADHEPDAELSAELAAGHHDIALSHDDEALMAEPEMLEPELGELDATSEGTMMGASAAEDAMLDTATEDVAMMEAAMDEPATTDAAPGLVAAMEANEELRSQDADAEVLSEEGESSFEENFSRVIDEESSVPDVDKADENQDERQQALDMLEHTEPQPHAVAAPDESFGASPGGEEDVSRDWSDRDEALKDNRHAVPENLARMTATMAESWQEHEEEAGHQAAVISLPMRKALPMKNGNLNLSGFQVSDDGKLRLSFDSGLAISFDPKTMQGEKRTINISGKPVTISCTAEGYQLELDGVELFYPAA